jgi:FAD/FMN-containing dehydrogenase
VLLEGHPLDIAAEREALGSGWEEVDGPPASARSTTQRSADPLTARTVELNQAVKQTFDPTGRLNPGRVLW